MVTGSTKGIGRAMVQGLAEAGASVVVSSRKQDLCDEVAAEIAATTGAEAIGLACHVGDWDAIPAFVDAVVERFGRIDVLVNNAGINPARVRRQRDDPRLLAQDLLGQPRGAAAHEPVRRPGHARRRRRQHHQHRHMAAYHAAARQCLAYGASKAALLNITQDAWPRSGRSGTSGSTSCRPARSSAR